MEIRVCWIDHLVHCFSYAIGPLPPLWSICYFFSYPQTDLANSLSNHYETEIFNWNEKKFHFRLQLYRNYQIRYSKTPSGQRVVFYHCTLLLF